jgi:diguanylate cyclase (GGDEF)-like protein
MLSFLTKRRQVEEEEEGHNGATKPTEVNDSDRALDALVRVLRTLARHGLGFGDDPAEAYEGWAKHLLMLHPPPGRSEPATRRHWAELLRFVDLRRQEEAAGVRTQVGELRHAVFSVAEVVARALAQDKQETSNVNEELEALRVAAEAAPPEALRAQALVTAKRLASMLAEREHGFRCECATLFDRIKTLDSELGQMREESSLDPMTRLHNRGALDLALDRAVTMAAISFRPVPVMMVDVDRFKSINDRFGHLGGDEVLRRIANCLALCFPRRSDLVARYGGEEFCVVPADAQEQDLPLLANRILNAVRALRVEFGGKVVPVTVSVGWALLRPGETKADWIGRADAALYRAKQNGRDRAEAA